MAHGLPYEVEMEHIGDYVGPQPAASYVHEIIDRMGIDDLGEIWSTYARVAGIEFPGMFGPEDAASQMLDYYFNLTPPEQRQVREFFDVPEGVNFNEWLGEQPEEQQQQMWAAASTKGIKQLGLALHHPVGDELLPSLDLLTDEEREELLQVEIDFFRYTWEREVEGRGGTWTDLMDKYYGDPTSGQGLFWATINRYALSDAAFDDPIMNAALDRIARGVFELEDEQWDEVTQYFMDNIDRLVDWDKTEIMQEHPEWVEQAATERSYLTSIRLLDGEQLRAEYFNVPYRERSQWEESNPEDWDFLRPYLAWRTAMDVGAPYYLYFYSPWTYRQWYGSTTPDQISPERAQALRDSILESLDTVWAYEEQGVVPVPEDEGPPEPPQPPQPPPFPEMPSMPPPP